MDHIVQSVDMSRATCVSFLDPCKAFDSLDHCILLQRIYDLGVGSQTLLWFKNYLSGHIHWVKSGDRYSDWGSISAGITQGSALGLVMCITKNFISHIMTPHIYDMNIYHDIVLSI